MKIVWLIILTFLAGLSLAVNVHQKWDIDNLLVTQAVNNFRIIELQKRQSRMQRVIKNLSKMRFF